MAKVVIDLYRTLLLENVDANKISENISDLLQAIAQGMEVLNTLAEKIYLNESLKDNCLSNMQIIYECSSKLLKSLNHENKFQYWTDSLKFSSIPQKDTVFKIYESKNKNVSQVQSNICKPCNILNNYNVGQLDSRQLSDFYWNCEDYVTFNIVDASHFESNELNSYIWKREEIENIGNIVNRNSSLDREVVIKDERPSNTSEGVNVPIECFSSNVRATTEAECDNGEKLTTYPSSKEDKPYESLQLFLKSTLRNYHFYPKFFADYTSIKDLLRAYTVREEVAYNIFELSNLIIVDSNLAIEKLAWHTIVNNYNEYSCILCKKNFSNTQLDNHLISSEHKRKLNWAKIWIPSQSLCATFVTNSRIHCSVCLTICKKQEMAQHIKSKVHEESKNSAVNKCSLILNNLKEILNLDKSCTKIIIRKLSPVLNRHWIELDKDEVLCRKCNESISVSVEDIYNHIHCQTHQEHCNTKFPGKNYRGFIFIKKTLNASYCTICQITLETTNEEHIENHIASYSHTVFLFLDLIPIFE